MNDTTPPLRADSPHDLVALVPYLLGHHPTDSIVMATFNSSRLIVTARFDLDAPDPVWESVAQRASDAGATRAQLIGYGPGDDVLATIERGRPILDSIGLDVEVPLRVDGDRFYGIGCTNPCCPPEGTLIQSHSAVVVQAIARGMVAFPDRAALAALVAPTGDAEQNRMRRFVDTARASTDLTGDPDSGVAAATTAALEQSRATYRTGGRLSDREVAALTTLLTDSRVLDTVVAHTTSDPTDLALWTDVTRRALPEMAAEPACVLAFTAALAGRGPLALVALERAIDADPLHALAHLLQAALRQGLSPTQIAQLQRERLAAMATDDAAHQPPR